MMRLVTSLALGLLLAGCAGGGQPRLPRDQIKRALAGAPGVAQPSKIVAAEIAFERMAREKGQWTAFRGFAAPRAIMHLRNGPVDAQSWLAERADPAETVRWSPRTVWMSCDATLAVSQGRFRNPQGIVGSFVTVWQRKDADDEYRWIYDAADPDNPQPKKRASSEPAGEDEILVTALDSIRGIVADCPGRGANRGENAPSPPATSVPEGIRHAVSRSADGTMQWRWEQGEKDGRRIVVEYLHDGQWQVALDRSLGSPVAAVASPAGPG